MRSRVSSDSFCTAKRCPIGDKCNRAVRGAVEKYGDKSCFIPPPFRINKGRFECDLFFGNPDDLFFFQLKKLY